MFCGKPGEGIHKTRVFGYAFWDLILTGVAAWLINQFTFNTNSSFWLILIALIVISVFVHGAMGIETALGKQITYLSSRAVNQGSR